jgi:hypothetical protein
MSLIEQAKEVFDRASDVQAALKAEDPGSAVGRQKVLKAIGKLREAIKRVPPGPSVGGYGEGGTVVQSVEEVREPLDPLETEVSRGEFNGKARGDFDRAVEDLGKAIKFAEGQEEGKP